MYDKMRVLVETKHYNMRMKEEENEIYELIPMARTTIIYGPKHAGTIRIFLTLTAFLHLLLTSTTDSTYFCDCLSLRGSTSFSWDRNPF